LNDGEDHELLFTMRPDDRLEGFLPGLQRIGVVQAGPREIIDGSGKSAPLVCGGFEHGR
jgi:thiamine monophosphate kinase